MKRFFVILAGAALLCSCGAQKNTTASSGALDTDGLSADEKVSTGYGEIPKEANTAAVTRIVNKDEEGYYYTNIYEYLEGKVPGLDVDPSTGTIHIRGFNSIKSDTTPLFVVDGMIYDNIMTLNPNEIYTVDVLKDSSSALYGARGANGVIVITTKAAANAQIMRDQERAERKAAKKAAKEAKKNSVTIQYNH